MAPKRVSCPSWSTSSVNTATPSASSSQYPLNIDGNWEGSEFMKVADALTFVFDEHERVSLLNATLSSQNKTLLSYVGREQEPRVPPERGWTISDSQVVIEQDYEQNNNELVLPQPVFDEVFFRSEQIESHTVVQDSRPTTPMTGADMSPFSPTDAERKRSRFSSGAVTQASVYATSTAQQHKLYDRIRQTVKQAEEPNLTGSTYQYQLAKGFISFKGIFANTPSFQSLPLLLKITRSNWFDTICAIAIVSNSIILAIATDYAARNHVTDQFEMPGYFTVLDYGFCFWFTLELIMRVGSDGPRDFWASRSNPLWAWNYFDTVVVTMNIFETVMQILGIGLGGGNVTVFRMLRVLRVARAVRVLRLVHLFKELRMMALCILKSYVTLLWSMVLLVITMFIFGTLLTQNVTIAMYMNREPGLTDDDAIILDHYYGDLMKTIYTLFVSVTGGIDWDNANNILKKTGWMNNLIFCFYIFFTMLALLNIISGIFLDSAMTAAHTDKDEVISAQLREENSAIQQMRQLFSELTEGKTTDLTSEEFDKHLTDPRIRAHLASLGLEAGEVQGLFRLLDLDDSGTVTVEEFLFGCMRMKGTAKALDVATLMYENKRMAEKWNKFMSFVKDQFHDRRLFEQHWQDKFADFTGRRANVTHSTGDKHSTAKACRASIASAASLNNNNV